MRTIFWMAAIACLAASVHAEDTAIDAPTLAGYADKSLAIVTQSQPRIGLVTAGSYGGTVSTQGIGVLGAALLVGIANGLTQANYAKARDKLVSQTETGFADHARGIAQALAGALKTRYGTPVLPDAEIAAGNTVEAVVAAAPTAQWILEVQTTSWGMLYFPTDWSHYHVNYSSRLRVIDASSKRILATSSCTIKQGDTRRPNIEQLATRDASLLRYYFQQAQFDCADQFATKVFGLAALPRPADALTDYRDNLRADDETAVPDIQTKGQEEYKTWLTYYGPKAFAIADNGLWGRAGGLKTTEPGAPADATMRALYNCKRYANQKCRLYAVNGLVVEGSDYAARMAATFEKGVGSAMAPPPNGAVSAPAAPTFINTEPTGFAKVDQIDLVPFLSDKGRTAYTAWLAKKGPKAFAISAAGYYAESVGTNPTDTSMPSDPLERSLMYCNKYSPLPCKLYAVNQDVVFAWD